MKRPTINIGDTITFKLGKGYILKSATATVTDLAAGGLPIIDLYGGLTVYWDEITEIFPAHGLYPHDNAEKLELPRNVKGWKGGPTASIYLLQCPEGWLASYSFHLFDGYFRGFSHGLSPQWHDDRFLATRAKGVAYGIRQLRFTVSTHGGRDAKRVLKWLESLQ